MRDRRKNETRLLDLNTTLSNKNTELKEQMNDLVQEYEMDCVPRDAESGCEVRM